jgi:C4-dicarboxylate-specific signal transduction histidine kinase
MSAGIAHELNQPLNAIKMGSDFLSLMVGQNRDIPKEHLGRVVGEISVQVDRAAAIISHLREFGRKSDLKKEKVDINEPIRGVFTIIGQQLALQIIDVTWICATSPQGMPFQRLEQVFLTW